MSEYLTCPLCKRTIEIVHGRWTQHTDPKTWPKGVPMKQCANARRPVASRSALSQDQGDQTNGS
jgi:hypothetical protein